MGYIHLSQKNLKGNHPHLIFGNLPQKLVDSNLVSNWNIKKYLKLESILKVVRRGLYLERRTRVRKTPSTFAIGHELFLRFLCYDTVLVIKMGAKPESYSAE